MLNNDGSLFKRIEIANNRVLRQLMIEISKTIYGLSKKRAQSSG